MIALGRGVDPGAGGKCHLFVRSLALMKFKMSGDNVSSGNVMNWSGSRNSIQNFGNRQTSTKRDHGKTAVPRAETTVTFVSRKVIATSGDVKSDPVNER
jgi:hypothetical protein